MLGHQQGRNREGPAAGVHLSPTISPHPPQIEKIRMEARWVIGVPKGATDRILSN